MDVLCNLPQQRWGDVATPMIGYRRGSAVRVTKLPMRTALADLLEAELLQQADDLARLVAGPRLSDEHLLDTDELRLDLRLAFLQQHLDHLAKVRPELIQGFTLRVSTRETGNVADI